MKNYWLDNKPLTTDQERAIALRFVEILLERKAAIMSEVKEIVNKNDMSD